MYAPGQVLEATLGFDAAMLTQHGGLGVLGAGQCCQERWRSRVGGFDPSQFKPIPPFPLNLFVQYTAPVPSDAGQCLGVGRMGWLLLSDLTLRPASTLPFSEGLAGYVLGASGLVVYAAPAFWTYNQLFAHLCGRTLSTTRTS